MDCSILILAQLINLKNSYDYLTYQSYIPKIHNLELILDYRNMSNKLGLSIKDYRYNQESQQVIYKHNWLTFGAVDSENRNIGLGVSSLGIFI